MRLLPSASDLCTLSSVYCCLSSTLYYIIIMVNQEFKRFVVPCSRFLTGDTHQLCVACLGVEHAQSVLEGAVSIA